MDDGGPSRWVLVPQGTEYLFMRDLPKYIAMGTHSEPESQLAREAVRSDLEELELRNDVRAGLLQVRDFLSGRAVACSDGRWADDAITSIDDVRRYLAEQKWNLGLRVHDRRLVFPAPDPAPIEDIANMLATIEASDRHVRFLAAERAWYRSLRAAIVAGQIATVDIHADGTAREHVMADVGPVFFGRVFAVRLKTLDAWLAAVGSDIRILEIADLDVSKRWKRPEVGYEELVREQRKTQKPSPSERRLEGGASFSGTPIRKVSQAPPPIRGIGAGRSWVPEKGQTPAAGPTNPDWSFWKALPRIEVWKASALSLDLEPDRMFASPTSWMAGPGAPLTFRSDSFASGAQAAEYIKRRRIIAARLARSEDDDRAYTTLAKVEQLADELGWATPEDMRGLAPDTQEPDAAASQPRSVLEDVQKMLNPENGPLAGVKLLATPTRVGSFAMQVPSLTSAPAGCDEVASPAVPELKRREHVLSGRRAHWLDAPFRMAKEKAADGGDRLSVWSALFELAGSERPPPPLLGVQGRSIKRQDGVKHKLFDLDAFTKYWNRHPPPAAG